MAFDHEELDNLPAWARESLSQVGTPEHVHTVIGDLWHALVSRTARFSDPNVIDMDLSNRSYIAKHERVLSADDRRKLAEIDRVIARRWDEISALLDPQQIADRIAEHGEHAWWTGKFPARVA